MEEAAMPLMKQRSRVRWWTMGQRKKYEAKYQWCRPQTVVGGKRSKLGRHEQQATRR